MSRAAPLLLWSSVLSVVALLLTVWASWDWLAYLMLWSAPALGFTWALVDWRVGPPVERPRASPEASLSTLVLAAGVVGLLLGPVVGLWSALLGGGLVVAGTAGLLRERRLR